MKRFLVLFVVFLLPVAVFGQTSVKKVAGEPTIFTWAFLAADEPKISGFRLYSSTVQSGPFTNLAGNAAVTARTLTIPAAFPTGSVMVFYTVRSYFTTSGQTVESGDSNSVEVVQSVPPSTNLQVR